MIGQLTSEEFNIVITVVDSESAMISTIKCYEVSQSGDLLSVSPGLIRIADKVGSTSYHGDSYFIDFFNFVQRSFDVVRVPVRYKLLEPVSPADLVPVFRCLQSSNTFISPIVSGPFAVLFSEFVTDFFNIVVPVFATDSPNTDAAEILVDKAWIFFC